MHLKEPETKTPPPWCIEPFPWRCNLCAKQQVYPARLDYDAEVRYDGRLVSFLVPNMEIPVCRACGEKVFTIPVDEQINAALRSHLHLLTPAEMRAAMERVELTETDVAERLGIAVETLTAWLNETQIQSRAMDNLLRVFFAFPRVRAALNRGSQDPQLGTADLTGRAG